MDNVSENAPSPAPALMQRRRGRPQAGPEMLRQRVEQLQAELNQAQSAMKQAEEKRAAIVGHACLRHARQNAEFSRQLAAALRAEVRVKGDRAAIVDLIEDHVANQ